MKIILVDDDLSVANSISSILKLAGFDCSGFSDPFHAYQDMKKNRYDLMITDINMPGISGFELYKLAKLTLNSLKVIYISGLFSQNSIPVSVQEDTLAFLSKPFQIEELINLIKVHKEAIESPAKELKYI